MILARSGRMIGLLIATNLASAISVVSTMNGAPPLLAAGDAGTGSRGHEAPRGPALAQEQEQDPYPTGNAISGQALYDASCIVCHGAGATGGIGPRLAGNPIFSNNNLFWDRVSKGRHMMPPLTDAISTQQIADIQAWLKTLR